MPRDEVVKILEFDARDIGLEALPAEEREEAERVSHSGNGRMDTNSTGTGTATGTGTNLITMSAGILPTTLEQYALTTRPRTPLYLFPSASTTNTASINAGISPTTSEQVALITHPRNSVYPLPSASASTFTFPLDVAALIPTAVAATAALSDDHQLALIPEAALTGTTLLARLEQVYYSEGSDGVVLYIDKLKESINAYSNRDSPSGSGASLRRMWGMRIVKALNALGRRARLRRALERKRREEEEGLGREVT